MSNKPLIVNIENIIGHQKKKSLLAGGILHSELV